MGKAELQHKAAEEVTELRKVHDRLIVEQAQKCARCGEVEQDVDEACQYIFESTIELTVVAKSKNLGETIISSRIPT